MTVFGIRNLLIVVVASLMLAACGGSTSGGDDDGGGSSGGSTGGGNSGGGGDETPAETTIRFGAFDGADFVQGAIDTNKTNLEAGQDATLRVALVNPNDAVVTDNADIRITSACISDGLAEVEPAMQTTADGRATATYTARGCDGEDTINAIAVVNDTSYSASVSVITTAAPAGALAFSSAGETQIGIQGSGGPLPEQSTLVFRATNASGGPAPNQLVNFSLNTSTGGIQLSNEQDTTDPNGLASTTVTSGTIATGVRVTAQATNSAGETLIAQSSQLAITTGLPDNGSTTIVSENLNLEGYDFIDTTKITALLADRFNNPAPDGTTVNFTTEGGSIGGSCLTEDGQCSVMFKSQNPRPTDGRITILATAVGEEDFIDSNGNGRFDDGESFDDRDEAFRDDDENGVRDNNEIFIDFSADEPGDGNFTRGDGRFTGVLCNSRCSENNSLNVRDDLVIVISGSTLEFDVSPSTIDLDSGVAVVTVRVKDERDQVAPAGTMVEAEATHGSLIGETSFEQPSTNGRTQAGSDAGVYTLRLEPEDDAGDGLLLLTATTPQGVISRASIAIRQDKPGP